MFDSLSSGLEKAWDIVRKDGKLTADNIKAPMREIRRALLEADVSEHLHRWRRQRLHAITWSCACTAVPPHDMVCQGWRALAPCPGATASTQGCKTQFETHDAPAGELVAGEPAGGAAVRGARGGGGAGGEGAQGRAPRPAAGQGRQRPARRADGRAAGGPGGGQGRPDAGEGFGLGLVYPERAHSHSGKTSRHPAESQRCLLAEVPGAAGLPDHLLQHGWCASCRSS